MNNENTTSVERTPYDAKGVVMSALINEFNLSQSYVQQYSVDFPQLDNLVDGVSIYQDPDAPFVADTTIGGLVRSIPRESLQQLPVLSVTINGTKNSIPALIASYLLKKTAFNEDTFGKGLLSTLQIGAEQALTHGYCPFLVATGSMYNDFGTTMRLIHYLDTSPEPGISDSNESGYHYVVANLTRGRVERILREAENNPDTLWNVEGLRRVLEGTPRSTDYQSYESDARSNPAAEAAGPTFQFVTRYETGPNSTQITFCPEYDEEPLRVMESRSKWGYPRVNYLVIDPAPLTPFGVSRVRLASPNQNLMNIYYASIASMLLLNAKPPILKRGRFLKPVQLKQGALWETLDNQATAQMQTMDNGSLQFFPQFAQQFAGQIQNIMGGQTMTVNAGAKNTGWSKTAPGVKQSEAFMNTTTNQVTKILENFLRQYALVALDTLLSEQTGVDFIIVDDETMNKINQLSPGFVGEDHKIRMDWERFYAAIEEWSVEVTVSLSKDEIDEKQREEYQDMLVVIGQNIDKLGPEAQEKFTQLTNLLLKDKAPLLQPISPMQQQPQMAQLPTAAQPNVGEEALTQ